MKYVQYYDKNNNTTRLFITDKFGASFYYLATEFLYFNAFYDGENPRSSMFYGQEMSLVDNYEEPIDENNLIVKDVAFPEFIDTINAIIQSGKFGVEKIKSKFWDIIWGEKNKDGNWY